MRKLVFTNAAQRDLDAIALYVAEQSQDRSTAENLIEKLLYRCERLALLPGILGSARLDLRQDLRSVPESGFVIFFRYQEQCIEIVNILHGSRDIISWYDTGDDH